MSFERDTLPGDLLDRLGEITERIGEIERLLSLASSTPGTGGAPVNAPYLVTTVDPTLTQERVATIVGGVTGPVDGGAGGAYTWTVHDGVTLDAGANVLMDISAGQELSLDNQAANVGFFGPVSGGAAAPTFRSIVAADLPGSFAGFANPTAQVGLSAVNGAATTAMRSDAAPALDQSIAPAWSALHTFSAGITFNGASGANNVMIPGNVTTAIELLDTHGLEYLRVITTTTQPIIRFNVAAADIDFNVRASGASDAFQVRGSDGQITLGVLGAGFVQADASGVLSSSAIGAGDLPAHAASHEVGGGDLVNHDSLTGFVVNEHIDHTAVTIGVSGLGLSGGGTIAANRTITLTSSSNPGAAAAVLATNAAGGIQLFRLYMAQYILHDGDADTGINLQDDRITLSAGGVNMIDVVEGTTDYIALGGSELRLPDGFAIGITGGELLTVNATGTFAFSGITGVSVENSDWIGIGAASERIEFYSAGHVAVMGANVGIRTTSVTDALTVAGNIRAIQDAHTTIFAEAHHNHNWQGGFFTARRSRGTAASETAVASGDTILWLDAWGYDGSAYDRNAAIAMQVDGAVSTGIVPTKIKFYTESTAGSYAQRMVIDNAGKVGINEASPSCQLHVDGGSATAIYGKSTGGSGISGESTATQHAGVYGKNDDSDGRGVYGTSAAGVGVFAYIGAGGGAGSQAVYALNDGSGWAVYAAAGNSYFAGKTGFGDSAPSYRIELPNTASSAGQGRANAWHTYSDKRLKCNVKTLNNALDVIAALNPIQYHQLDGDKNDGKLKIGTDKSEHWRYGLCAQELYEVLPAVVSRPKDEETDMWSINYTDLTAWIIASVQEINQRMEVAGV